IVVITRKRDDDNQAGPRNFFRGPVLPSASTTRPVVWKAHGTAEHVLRNIPVKARLAGLFQVTGIFRSTCSKAVLEQPSSRGIAKQALGRRNIALSQSDELDQPKVANTLPIRASKRKQQSWSLRCATLWSNFSSSSEFVFSSSLCDRTMLRR